MKAVRRSARGAGGRRRRARTSLSPTEVTLQRLSSRVATPLSEPRKRPSLSPQGSPSRRSKGRSGRWGGAVVPARGCAAPASGHVALRSGSGSAAARGEAADSAAAAAGLMRSIMLRPQAAAGGSGVRAGPAARRRRIPRSRRASAVRRAAAVRGRRAASQLRWCDRAASWSHSNPATASRT